MVQQQKVNHEYSSKQAKPDFFSIWPIL
jgi:hypothetical protein